jgi:rubrerythrin
MSAIDAYDQSYQLQYYWDLNPSLDSDGNGDSTDDPDFVGSDVELSFANSGTKDIVVTVFDQSGNSDSHAFSVKVASATEPTSMFGVIVISLFAFVVVMAVSMIGFRRWQTGIAVQLLQGRGLSEQEAKQHISMVKQKTRIPIFADAAQISGLDSNVEVTTKESQQEQLHQAEYQSIYGGNNETQSNIGSAFAPPANTYAPAAISTPQPQYNTATHAAASDALAMFEEEENQEIIASNTEQDAVVKVTEVVSGGIELPFQVKSQIENVPEVSKPDKQIEPVVIDEAIKEVSCPLCDFSFKIRIPEVDEAIVACPSCNKDFKLRFE